MGTEDYEKRIYFIGGYLDKAEVKRDFKEYRKMIDKVWVDEAVRDKDLLNHPIISVPRCTKEQLEWIWKDEHTYGIIWYSHGDQDGYPLAYHSSIDEPWQQLSNEEKISVLRLDPKKTWKPGPNLKFVAFQSCYSQKLKEDWEKALPGIQIKTHEGKLIWTESAATNVPVDQMKMWINEDKWWFESTKPTDGVRYLFRYVIDNSQKPPSQGGRGLDKPATPSVAPDAGVPEGVPEGVPDESTGVRDAGVPDESTGVRDAGPYDITIKPAAGVPVSQKTGTDSLDAGAVSDLSERIKVLPDLDENPQVGLHEQMASVVPDLSERIKIIPDLDEKPQVGPEDRQASVVPDLSERIKIIPDLDEKPQISLEDRLTDFLGLEDREPFKPFADNSPMDRPDADRLTDFLEDREPLNPLSTQSHSERLSANRLTDFLGLDNGDPSSPLIDQSPSDKFSVSRLTGSLGQEDREPFKPFADSSPFDRYGADQLTDIPGREPLRPFADSSPFDRYGADQLTDIPGREPLRPFADQDPMDRLNADRLTDFLGQKDREPFKPFADSSPFDRYGADQLTDIPGREPFKDFADQSPLNRFGGNQLTNLPGPEPFKPIAETPQWMKNAFTEPPRTASLMNQQPQQPFGDKPKWRI